jgi:hypothetical protein
VIITKPPPAADARSMDDSWIYIEGKRGGRAYMANVRHPLADLRHPDYEHHITLELRYAPHWLTGLPKPRELTRLQDFEDRTISHLEGHGVLAGSETCDATRTVHLYIRGGGRILELYRKRAATPKGPGVSVSVSHDPEWREIDHLAQASQRAAA